VPATRSAPLQPSSRATRLRSVATQGRRGGPAEQQLCAFDSLDADGYGRGPPRKPGSFGGRVGLAARPPQTKTAHGGAGGGRLPRRTRRPSHPSGRGVPLEAAGEVHRVGAAGETTRARSAGGSHNEAVPPTDPSSGSPARVNAPGWKRASKPARPPHRVPAESPRSSLALRGSFPFTTRAVSRSFEPSLQSSLQLSLTVRVCYRSRGAV